MPDKYKVKLNELPNKNILGTPWTTDDNGYNWYEASRENVPTQNGEHASSRNPYTGRILKSVQHPTFNKTVIGEKIAGYDFYTDRDNNLYSFNENPGEDYTPINIDIDENEIKNRQAFMESRLNPNAESYRGARGLFQIIPRTQKAYEKENKVTVNPFNPEHSTQMRDWLWKKLDTTKTTQGNKDFVVLAKKLAAYNYGQGNLGKALEKAKTEGIDIYNTIDFLPYLPKETQNYVKFILMNEDAGKTYNKDYDKAIGKYQSPSGPLPFKWKNITIPETPSVNFTPTDPYTIADESLPAYRELQTLNERMKKGEITPSVYDYKYNNLIKQIHTLGDENPSLYKTYFQHQSNQALNQISETVSPYKKAVAAKSMPEIGPLTEDQREYQAEQERLLNARKNGVADIYNNQYNSNLSYEDWEKVINFYNSPYKHVNIGAPMMGANTVLFANTQKTVDRHSDPRYAELNEKYPEVISNIENEITENDNKQALVYDGIPALLGTLAAGAPLLSSALNIAGMKIATAIPNTFGRVLGTAVANPINTSFIGLNTYSAGKNFSQGNIGNGLIDTAFAAMGPISRAGQILKTPSVALKARPLSNALKGTSPVGKVYNTPLGKLGVSPYVNAWQPNALGKVTGYAMQHPMQAYGLGMIGKGLTDQNQTPVEKWTNISLGTAFSAGLLKNLKR